MAFILRLSILWKMWFFLATEDANYLISNPIHSSQHVMEDSGTEVTFELNLRITPDFIMEIISRSWSVKIIKPESLRKQVCDIYIKALERNR